MLDICALSTVHYAYDNRIYQKQARALAAAGLNVAVVGRREEHACVDDKIDVHFVASHNRRWRRFLGALLLMRRALRLRARVYIVHDPELLPLALALKLCRRCVVYDMHEDMPAQIGMKEWLPRWSRRSIGALYRHIESWTLRRLDGLVLAENGYETAYPHAHRVTVLNYPLIDGAGDTAVPSIPGPVVAYVGTITERRGLFTMLEAARRIKQTIPAVHFKLVGPINVSSEARRANAFVAAHGLADTVEFTGRLAPPAAHAHLKDARVGLALLEPEPNYLHSLPTKLFEYMLAGVPVVCSDVPLWQRIVEEADSGLVVDPHDMEAVVAQLLRLLGDDQLWKRCATAGHTAVRQRYSWASQVSGLVDFYAPLVASGTSTPAR